MPYELGIDLGTTYTGAAIHRDGRVEVSSLGSRAAAIPSVVLLRDDDTVLTGEAAVRRALSEPARVAREFKRRLGDTTPILVGGAPYSAEALMARLLRSVVDEVTTREGSAPASIAVSHPANWGAYKIDLLHQAVRLADLDPDRVSFVTEPEAAATFYAHQERVEPGEVVAVYDLGGGTFDAAVLRAGADGFEILGRPEGIERLGGIDFDAAVFNHVTRSLGGLFDELDPDDSAAQNAVARLRQECVDAKEALSSDTDAVVPVLLPNVQTEVRITRSEFEALIRPALADSIAAMRRAMKSAGVEATDVAKVLLVGGSSRIPLIAQLVSAELGRPVAVDAHPKHAVSMGAAYEAARHSRADASGAASAGSGGTGGAAVAGGVVAGGVVGGGVAAGADFVSADEPTVPVIAEMTPPPGGPTASMPTAATPTEAAPLADLPTEAMSPPAAATTTPPTASPEPAGDNSRAPLLVGAGLLAAIVIAVAVFVFASGNGDDDVTADEPVVTEPVVTDPPATDPPGTDPPETDPAATTTEPAASTLPPRDPAAIGADVMSAIAAIEFAEARAAVEVEVSGDTVLLTGQVDDDDVLAEVLDAVSSVDGVVTVTDGLAIRPPDERCTDEVRDRDRWVCVVGVELDGDAIRATYLSEFAGDVPQVEGGFHYHVFGSQIAVEEGGVPGGGPWLVWDDEELDIDAGSVFGPVEVPEKLCMRIATSEHRIDDDSGSCRPIELPTS